MRNHNDMNGMVKLVGYIAVGVFAAFAVWEASTLFVGAPETISIHPESSRPVSFLQKNAESPIAPKSDAAEILSAFRGKDVERVSVNEKIFALTFDGGGDAKDTERILATLAKHSIPATFFLTGHFVETFPEMTDAIRKSEGEVANHTMTHKDLSKLSREEVVEEIAGMERIAKERGIDITPFFRFPYGAPTKETIALANDRGYVSVRWTVDSLGWQGAKDGRDASFVAQRVIEKAVPGGIALMHLGAAKDGTTFDADALPEIISALKEQGYRFVALSELFAEAIKNTAQ